MSIAVNNLSRHYHRQVAVNNISFSVGAGEVTGFLGPNGAGKSTTMKMITGFLSPSTGSVAVCGLDVQMHPLEVKQRLGYLPEHNPLYLDMYVHEYLRFIARLYGMSAAQSKIRTEEMVQLCGLTPEQGKRIGMLSKGFRQRVGLAQALIHDPDVLVLDEPTSGLDPNQLVEIRRLIKTVSKNKTVLFSSHILQEVQALCDRVIVIHRGVIVRDDTLEKVMRSEGSMITVEFAGEVDVSILRAIAGVEEVKHLEKHRFRIRSGEGVDIRPSLLSLAAEKKWSLLEMKKEENSLESIFSQLTAEEKRTSGS